MRIGGKRVVELMRKYYNRVQLHSSFGLQMTVPEAILGPYFAPTS